MRTTYRENFIFILILNKIRLGNQLESQLIPIPEQVLAIPGRKSAAKYELVFHAEDLPPLAAKQFLVSSTGNKIRHRQIQKKRTTPQQDPAIKNGVKYSIFKVKIK